MNTNTQTPLKPLTPEEIEARRIQRQPGTRLPIADKMRTLEQALDEAHQVEGETIPQSRVDRPTFGADSVTKVVEWKNQLFGEMKIKIESFTLSNPKQLDRFTMVTPLFMHGSNPNVINFTLSQKLAEGVRLYHAQSDVVTDCTNGKIPEFHVSAEWTDAVNRQIPHTRKGDEDNVDLVFLDKEGCFVQLEISLVTRHSNFFLVIQQVYAGQVVRTTVEKAKKTGLETIEVNDHVGTAVPLYPENAYPGSDYIKNFKAMAPSFIRLAIEAGSSVPLSKCHVARWDPQEVKLPAEMQSAGWQVAHTSWFNDVIGWGFLYCSDGKPCFAHFKQILDQAGKPAWKNGKFPHLTPMRGVAVKYENQPDGKRKATAIRIL